MQNTTIGKYAMIIYNKEDRDSSGKKAKGSFNLSQHKLEFNGPSDKYRNNNNHHPDNSKNKQPKELIDKITSKILREGNENHRRPNHSRTGSKEY